MIHRLVSVLKAIKNGTSPATLHARGFHSTAPKFLQSRRPIVQVILGQAACWAEAPADGASATVCKAACLNTQQTVKNDVNRPCRDATVLRGSFYGKASSQTVM
jgi:hypothetical protein